MKDTYVIENPADSLLLRVPMLIIGLLFLGFGFLAVGRTVLAMIQNLLGTANTGSFGLGLFVGFSFMFAGTFPFYLFVKPAKTLYFDATAKQVRLVVRYPFGIKKRYAVSFDETMLPKLVWIVDTESMNKGHWALEVALPDGTIMRRLDRQRHPQAQQKATITQWCDDVAQLMT